VLAATQAVTGAMARAQSPARAVESLVASLGSSMGWELGGYWSLAADEVTLELVVAWSAAGIDARDLVPPRLALAGSLTERAFTVGRARWTSDLAADTALYLAKQAGRNRTVAAR
jgi:hypothetical protein